MYYVRYHKCILTRQVVTEPTLHSLRTTTNSSPFIRNEDFLSSYNASRADMDNVTFYLI